MSCLALGLALQTSDGASDYLKGANICVAANRRTRPRGDKNKANSRVHKIDRNWTTREKFTNNPNKFQSKMGVLIIWWIEILVAWSMRLRVSSGLQWCTSATTRSSLPSRLSRLPGLQSSPYSQERPNNIEEYLIPILVIPGNSLPLGTDNKIGTRLVATSIGIRGQCGDIQSQTNYLIFATSKSIE